MKIEILLSKDEFEHISKFAQSVGYEVKIAEDWGEDKLLCEFDIVGRSAHFLFHAGIDYAQKLKK